MTSSWPSLTLIDSGHSHRHRFELIARKLGVRFRALPAPPTHADSDSCRVRLVVQVMTENRTALDKVRMAFPCARVVVCGTSSSQDAAVQAFRAGADDFIAPGTGDQELSRLIGKHLCGVAGEEGQDGSAHGMAGNSPALKRLCAFAARIAPTNVTVLITGETGTGKDCLAAMVHRLSLRAQGPLVAINCAAIPDALLEGELFGYERGAFTGALNTYPGKLKLADSGTLLLDEIGELSLAGQAKVLRAIETGEVYRLGARAPTRFDARIIAATNCDLAAETAAKRFREDLFYRLAVAQLMVPPLRDRIEDVAPIARRLLDELSVLAGRPGVQIGADAMMRLEAHSWPGNVRELRNVIEIAMVTCVAETIGPGDLPPYLAAGSKRERVKTDERARLLTVLESAGGNKSEAAKVLNCSRMTLYRKLARHGIDEGGAIGSSHMSQPLSRQLLQKL